MKTFLCLVIERIGNEEIYQYIVKAEDWYYARHKAADTFTKTYPNLKGWAVDSIEVTEKEVEKMKCEVLR